MGIIISRFRKKQTTEEILEGIDKRVTELQKLRWRNQQLKKQYIGSLILYSIIIYILAALVFYFYYLPETWKERLLYSIPLLIFPVMVWLFKKFLHWYFVKRIAKSDIELEEIRSKKKQILEDVMENETYKKAKEILEKYDPERFKKVEKPTPKSTPSPQTTGLRQRTVGSRGPTPMSARGRGMTPGATPRLPHGRGTPMQPRQLMSVDRNGQPVMSPYNQAPGPPLPRPVLPRERGKMDKLVEYFVGDGPQNRYALICRYCHSHNGMALKEEFEYLTFRCCYCYQLNPARKQKPYAPKIDFTQPSVSSPMTPAQSTIGKGTPATGKVKQTTADNKDKTDDVSEDDDDASDDDDSVGDDSGDEGGSEGEEEMEIDETTDSNKPLSGKEASTGLPPFTGATTTHAATSFEENVHEAQNGHPSEESSGVSSGKSGSILSAMVDPSIETLGAPLELNGQLNGSEESRPSS